MKSVWVNYEQRNENIVYYVKVTNEISFPCYYWYIDHNTHDRRPLHIDYFPIACLFWATVMCSCNCVVSIMLLVDRHVCAYSAHEWTTMDLRLWTSAHQANGGLGWTWPSGAFVNHSIDSSTTNLEFLLLDPLNSLLTGDNGSSVLFPWCEGSECIFLAKLLICYQYHIDAEIPISYAMNL